MDAAIDGLIALLEDLKSQGPVNQLLFVLAIVGPPLALIAWLYRRLSGREAAASQELEKAQGLLKAQMTRTEAAEAAARKMAPTDPVTYLDAYAKNEPGQHRAVLTQLTKKYLEGGSAAMATAFTHRARRMLGFGGEQVYEAQRLVRGAIAADPQHEEARELAGTIEEAIARTQQQPETEEAVAEAAERQRHHALIADDSVDWMTLDTVGAAEVRKGWYLSAAAIWDRALELVEKEDGANSVDALLLRLKIGRATLWGDEIVRAGRIITPLPGAFANQYSETSMKTANALMLYGQYLAMSGDPIRSLEILERALFVQNAIAPEDPDTLSTRYYIVKARLDQGDAQGAERELRTLLPMRERVSGPEASDTISTKSLSGHVHMSLGDAEKAETIFRTVAELSAKIDGPEHPSTLTCWFNVARARLDSGHADDAAKLAENLVSRIEAAFLLNHSMHDEFAKLRADIASAQEVCATVDEEPYNVSFSLPVDQPIPEQ